MSHNNENKPTKSPIELAREGLKKQMGNTQDSTILLEYLEERFNEQSSEINELKFRQSQIEKMVKGLLLTTIQKTDERLETSISELLDNIEANNNDGANEKVKEIVDILASASDKISKELVNITKLNSSDSAIFDKQTQTYDYLKEMMEGLLVINDNVNTSISQNNQLKKAVIMENENGEIINTITKLEHLEKLIKIGSSTGRATLERVKKILGEKEAPRKETFNRYALER